MKNRAVVVCAPLLLAGILAAGTPALRAAEGPTNPHIWKPRTTSVAVFKNGYGFFQRDGETTLREGWTLAEGVPPATFGSVAIYSKDEGEIVDLVGSGEGEKLEFNGTDQPDTADARRAALQARLNLSVAISWKHANEDRESTGRLVSAAGEYAVLEGPAGNSAVPVAAIKSIRAVDLPLRIHVDGSKDERTNLTMSYLRGGITWVPEYTLRVIDESSAELTLRGTLINEAEDLIGADVNFVVGVPNFAHKDYDSPIASAPTLRALSASFAPAQLQSQIANNAFVTQNGERTRAMQDDAAASFGETLSTLPVLESVSASDYTVYRREDLTVRRGERAVVTLFVKRIAYKHQYRCTPGEAIKHSLVLDNNTDSAWTTGPCLALSSGNPLSEDLLRYTPAGSKGEVPVTSAMNIMGDRKEAEIDRKLRDYSPNNNNDFLDLVRVRGDLSLASYEDREIDVIVTAPITGKPVTASDNGAITVDSAELRLTERRGSVTWRLTLKPREKKTITYEYERYVASR